MFSLATRIFAALMTVLFLISAGLQYNDPDPLVWISLYGAGAALAGMHAAGRSRPKAALVLAAIAVVWAVSLAPDFFGKVAAPDLVQEMKASRPEIEEAREAGGLLIVAVTMLVIALVKKPAVKEAAGQELTS